MERGLLCGAGQAAGPDGALEHARRGRAFHDENERVILRKNLCIKSPYVGILRKITGGVINKNGECEPPGMEGSRPQNNESRERAAGKGRIGIGRIVREYYAPDFKI